MRKSLLVLLTGLTLVACAKNDAADPPASSAAPSPDPKQAALTVTEADNGQERNLLSGQRLSVTLPANPSTGYQWRLAELDQTVLRQDGEPDYRPDPTVPVAPGSGGTSNWTFEAKAAGVTKLMLDYARPWEQGMEPAQKFMLTIKVE